MSFQTFTVSDTSPASAITAVGDSVGSLDEFDWFTIDADLVGATGGTLDIYLQRQVAEDLWRDWLHFPQLADTAAAVKYTAVTSVTNSVVVVGGGTDATPGVALAANTFIGGHPGNKVRAVYVAGAGTSAGAAVTIRVTGWKRRV